MEWNHKGHIDRLTAEHVRPEPHFPHRVHGLRIVISAARTLEERHALDQPIASNVHLEHDGSRQLPGPQVARKRHTDGCEGAHLFNAHNLRRPRLRGLARTGDE